MSIIKEVRLMPDGNIEAIEKKLLERLPEVVQKLVDQREAEIKLNLEKDYEKRLHELNILSANVVAISRRGPIRINVRPR